MLLSNVLDTKGVDAGGPGGGGGGGGAGTHPKCW